MSFELMIALPDLNREVRRESQPLLQPETEVVNSRHSWKKDNLSPIIRVFHPEEDWTAIRRRHRCL
jgi:hypothetical protein